MSRTPTGDGRQSTLGACPDCDRRIRAAQVLVEYERSDGESDMFAECPGCGNVVHPD